MTEAATRLFFKWKELFKLFLVNLLEQLPAFPFTHLETA